MARPIVVFNCARNYAPGSLEQEMPRVMAQCDVRLTEARDGVDLARELADADVLVARRDYVGRATLDLASRLRGIVTPGVGVEKRSTLKPPRSEASSWPIRRETR